MGDFNLPKVDWQSLAPTPECKFPTFYRECLEVINDCLLDQTVTSPTQGKHILDLFSTSNPTRDFSDPFGNGSGTCPFGKNSNILLQIGNFHGLVRCVY